MRPIVRLVLIYVTAFRVQRYAGAAGALLLVLGLAGTVLVDASLSLLLVPLGTVLVVFASLFAAGWLLLVLSAPRTHRLLPHFRRRMLAALLVLLVLPVPLWVALVILTDAPLAPGPAALYPLAMFSAVIWFTFFSPASFWVAFPGVPLLYAAVRSLEPWLDWPDPSAAAALVGVLLAFAWLAFGTWYLRAARIGPFGSFFPRWRSLAPRRAGEAGQPITDDAVHVYLRGGPAHSAREGIVAVVVWAAICLLLVSLAGRQALRGLTVVPLAAMMAAAPVANRLARTARRLWLLNGRSRAELFHVVERSLARWALGVVLLGVAVLAAFLVWRGAAPVSIAAAMAACALATGAYAAYLGLMFMNEARVADIVLGAALLVTAAAAAAVLLDEPRSTALLVIAACQITGALLCRTLAARRWRRIDWTRLRPGRLPLHHWPQT